MYCVFCGKNLPVYAKFCFMCGEAVPVEVTSDCFSDVTSLRLKKYKCRYPTGFADGPNSVWNCQVYTKFEKYGFSIYTGVDGFSRRILWARVTPSDHPLKYPADYFLAAIECYGCPKYVRTDDDWDEGLLGKLHRNVTGECGEQHIGNCPNHQNIKFFKNFWNGFVPEWTNAMAEVCQGIKKMKKEHLEALRFTYLPVFEVILAQNVQKWNDHFVKNSETTIWPRPETPLNVFEKPQLHGTKNYALEYDKNLLLTLREKCGKNSDTHKRCVNFNFQLELHSFCSQQSLDANPDTIEKADSLFLELRQLISRK